MQDKQSRILRLLRMCILVLAIVLGGLVICTLLLQWRPVARPQQALVFPPSTAVLSSPPAVQTPATDVTVSQSPDLEEELPTLSAYQANLLQALFDAFVDQEEDVLEAAVENWSNARFEAIVPTETPWESLNGLAWDGERLHKGYSRIGLQFDGLSFYYGELTNGTPDGQGTCITVDTYYLEGSVGYVRTDGQWENGVMVGSGVVRRCKTGSLPYGDEYIFHCTFDGTPEEVMVQGTLCIYYWAEENIQHSFKFIIQDGYLTCENLEFNSIMDLSVLACNQHTNCGVKLVVDDQMDQLCQNIYPWDRESPYETPSYPPMLSFSWMG